MRSFRGLHDHSLASWLRRIAVNVCLNRLKTPAAKVDKLTAELSEFEMEAVSADLKEKSAEELIVQRDLLAKLLGSLNADDRVLLQMLHGQEMSVADIAEIFGWSRAKVKVRAFRARRALNRMLKRFL
jgi:RNA polymerase sigma-70 factor, ECF subfamily